MTIEGGNKPEASAKQKVTDLSKFLKFTNNRCCDLHNICNMKNIIKYLNALRQTKVGLSGQIGKLTVLMHALAMLVSEVDESALSEEEKQLIIRSTIIKMKVQALVKSMRSEYKAIRTQKRDLFDPSGGQREMVLQFLENTQLIEVVEEYVSREGELLPEEKLRLRRFLTCSLLYRNCQRQSAVSNLTLAEYESAVQHDITTGQEPVTIFKVWEHKTNTSFGHARLMIPTRAYNLIQGYTEKARATPTEGCESYVFLTPTGRRITHLSAELRLLSTDFPTKAGVLEVTATQLRKLSPQKWQNPRVMPHARLWLKSTHDPRPYNSTAFLHTPAI